MLAVPAAVTLAIFLVAAAGKVTAKFCDGGHYCSPPKECCTLGCCYVYSPSVYRPPTAATANLLSFVFWNHWYFWFVVVVSILSCLGGCCLWRKRHCCCRRQGRNCNDEPSSERDSTGSCYPPPQYSRCSSFHHAPPPYTEVTSKPDLYPLVISYNDNGKGVSGNYLMVQYFRNYLVRPMTSLSATSTADSLSSSFLYATNEANTIVPPPYSCAGSLEEFHQIPPPPRSVSSLTNYNGGCHDNEHNYSNTGHTHIESCQPGLPDSRDCLSREQTGPPRSLALQNSYLSATALSTTGSDISSLAGVGTPGSPPQATSPTSEIRELLDKIQQLPMAEDVDEIPNRSRRQRPRRMYMPLTLNLGCTRKKTRHWLPRSAPTTPCGNLPPILMTRPASSSSRKGDGSPLLEDRGSDEEDDEDADEHNEML